MSAEAGALSRIRAPFGRRAATVLLNEHVGAYQVLHASDPAGPAPAPGQFYMLAGVERWGAGEDDRPFLGRAFSVLRAGDGGDGLLRLQFLLEGVGPGTRRLSELRAGDGLWLTGPLGVGFAAPDPGRRALLVGGGVGIAPLAIWQDELLGRGVAHTVLLGFRDAAHAAGARLLADVALVTDDGGAGHAGPVTDLLVAELDRDAHAVVYACGPPAMLEAVRALCAERAVPAQLALEAGMACGYGACFGCAVPIRGGGYLRVCLDGPVVDAALLDTALAPR